MKRKRLICAVLALVLLFFVQPAAALTSNKPAVVINATTRLPIISVTVPSHADVLINPFGLPVWIGDEEADEQILCTPSYVFSQSDVPLRVDVTVTGSVKPGSDLQLVNSSTGGTGTQKRAFIYFEMQQSDGDDPDYVTWDRTYNAAKHILIEDGKSAGKQGIVTLPALTLDGEIPEEDGYAHFRLTGDATRAPTNEWTAKDGINVTVAFTFTPIPYNS